jgi:hypothetical protein
MVFCFYTTIPSRQDFHILIEKDALRSIKGSYAALLAMIAEEETDYAGQFLEESRMELDVGVARVEMNNKTSSQDFPPHAPLIENHLPSGRSYL